MAIQMSQFVTLTPSVQVYFVFSLVFRCYFSLAGNFLHYWEFYHLYDWCVGYTAHLCKFLSRFCNVCLRSK